MLLQMAPPTPIKTNLSLDLMLTLTNLFFEDPRRRPPVLRWPFGLQLRAARDFRP